MRPIVLLFAATIVSGCTDETVDENMAYRRLLDAYDSEAACTAATVNACYQTLTLCTNGNATVDLDRSPRRGTYLLDGSVAHTEMIDMTFAFDLDTRSSPDLPGRHAWVFVEPLIYDCGR